MIPNEEKEIYHYLAVKSLSALLGGITTKHHGDFEQKINLNLTKKYVKIKVFAEL